MSSEPSNKDSKNQEVTDLPLHHKKWFKWLMGLFLVALIVVFGFVRLTAYLAGNLIKKQVFEHSNGVYELGFENLEIDWVKTRIILKQFEYKKVRLDTANEKEFYFGADLTHIQLENLRGIYFEQALHVVNITVQSPSLKVVQHKKSKKKQSFSLESGDFYKMVQGFVKSFQVDDFEVRNLHADYYQEFKKPQTHYIVNDLSFKITNFYMDSSAVASNDEFFFTEAFGLKISDQSIDLGDSIHQIHFDSLILSTKTNNIEIFNLQIDTIQGASVKLAEGNLNKYLLYVPYTGVKGLDFKRAYVENVLQIDSIVFDDLNLASKIKSIARNKSKITADTTVNNRVIKLLLGLFDRIELDRFKIIHAQLQVKYANNDAARVKGVTFDFTKFVLDSNALKTNSYYPDFEGLNLVISKPGFDLPNGSKLNADRLRFSTYDSTLIIDKAILKSSKNIDIMGTDILFEKLKLTGVNPKEIINSNEINLNELILLHPQLQLLITSNQKNTSSLNLHSFINGKIKRYHIGNVKIVDGDAKLMTTKTKLSPNKIGKFNVTLKNFTLDENTLNSNRFLLSRNAKLNFDNVAIYVEKMQHYVRAKHLSLTSVGGVVQFDELTVSPFVNDSSKLTFVANITAGNFKVAGIDFRRLKHPKKLNLSEVMLDNVQAKINLLVLNDSTKNDSHTSSVLSKFEEIELSNVNVSNIDLIFQKQGKSVAKFSNAYIKAEALKAHPEKLKSGRLVFLTDSIQYGVDRLMAPLSQNNHTLFIESVHRTKDSTLTIKGLSIRPMPGKVISDSAMKLITYVPEVKISNFHSFENHFTDSLQLGQIEINKPFVKLRLPLVQKEGKSRFSLSSSLPAGFLDDEFTAIGLESFVIKDGNVSIVKNNLSIAVHRLNLNSINWLITENSTWNPNKFMFADDFNLSLEELDYHIPGIDFCHHIDSLSYKFRPSNLTVHGIYFNNWSLTEKRKEAEFSMYLPYIRVSNPSVYQYLTDSNIVIDKIETRKGFFEANIYGKEGVQKEENRTTFTVPTEIPTSLKGFKNLSVNQFIMDKMDVQMSIHKNGVVSPLEMNHFTLQVDSFHIYPGEKMDSNRVLWSDNIELSVKNIYTTTDGGLYELGADELRLSTQKDTIGVEGLSFVPTVARYEYALHKGHRKDVFNISLKQFGVSGLDYSELLYNKSIRGKVVNVAKPMLAILKDKRIPEPSYKYKSVIPEMFKRIPVKITFDSVMVNEMKIRYEEFPESGRKPGNIMLTHMNIKALNVTNDTVQLRQDSSLKIFMNSKLLDTADLALFLDYNMLTPNNEFKMSTSLGSFDGTLLNRYIEPVFAAKLVSANIERMDMSVIGNDSIAGGKMGLYYTDLKFSFLNKDPNEKKGFSTKLKSMIGNSIIKSKNKYHAFKRREPLFFERITGKGWINYLVKIELAGVASSVGLKSYKKDLKQANKMAWKEFDKADKAERKVKAKAAKRKKKQLKKL